MWFVAKPCNQKLAHRNVWFYRMICTRKIPILSVIIGRFSSHKSIRFVYVKILTMRVLNEKFNKKWSDYGAYNDNNAVTHDFGNIILKTFNLFPRYFHLIFHTTSSVRTGEKIILFKHVFKTVVLSSSPVLFWIEMSKRHTLGTTCILT